MSLTYFTDADQQISPKMFENVGWEQIKSYIENIVRKYR